MLKHIFSYPTAALLAFVAWKFLNFQTDLETPIGKAIQFCTFKDFSFFAGLVYSFVRDDFDYFVFLSVMVSLFLTMIYLYYAPAAAIEFWTSVFGKIYVRKALV